MWLHLQGIQTEFYDLSTERQIGMGLGPIPSSKIRERAAELEFDDDEAERFFAIIRRVDDEYRTLNNTPEKNKKLLSEVAANDAQGMSKLFGRLEKQHNDKRQRKKSKQ